MWTGWAPCLFYFLARKKFHSGVEIFCITLSYPEKGEGCEGEKGAILVNDSGLKKHQIHKGKQVYASGSIQTYKLIFLQHVRKIGDGKQKGRDDIRQ